jgi:hypothetical protein
MALELINLNTLYTKRLRNVAEKRQAELEKMFSLTILPQTLVLIGNVLTFL